MATSTPPDAVPLRTHTLFLACTRPAMKLGVPAEGFVINMIGTFYFFLLAGRGNPAYLTVGVLFHYVMRALAANDPNFFRVWMLWVKTKANAGGQHIYGAGCLVALPSWFPRKPHVVEGCV